VLSRRGAARIIADAHSAVAATSALELRKRATSVSVDIFCTTS
jgi:hypothetical protein